MLTEDQISQKALEFARATGTANIDFATYHFQHGAAWANEQNAQEIAELVDALRELKLSVGKFSTQVPTKDLYAWNLVEKTLAKYEK